MVHFVGAGPGAPDLITVRGKKFIERADVILYAGSLVNPEILSAAKTGCRIYNTAKMSLDEVIAVMEEARDLDVVRLHTGDPTLYGAIREQMERLDVLRIPYDVVPGVSAFQAASASLKRELTLPSVSQSVILTREEGRTAVPDRQTVRSYAAHRATMVLYLSSSLTEKAQAELLAGGYPPSTPVDVVYKASWPEEKILHTCVRDFPQVMERAGITRLAVIMIGDVFAERPQEREVEESKLYSYHYSTGYRAARRSLVWMCACTEQGAVLMKKLAAAWSEETHSGDSGSSGLSDNENDTRQLSFDLHVKCASRPENEKEGLKELVAESFSRADVVIFFAASGIVVRSIAPFLKGKAADPAVLVVDEKGKYCIPLLSGHIGGANRYAETVSRLLGTEPVVTTATDLEHRFAVDVFARDNGLLIRDFKKMKEISARVVRGEVLRVLCGAAVEGNVPSEVRLIREGQYDGEDHSSGRLGSASEDQALIISDAGDADLIIPDLYLGIGCRRSVPRETISELFHRLCETEHLAEEAFSGIASIDLKKEEAGLLAFSKEQKLPVRFYTASELASLEGEFNDSAFVRSVAGVGNVCERAAVKLAGEGAELLVRKMAADGVTMAVARRRRVLSFSS